jgi:hypothetical protein
MNNHRLYFTSKIFVTSMQHQLQRDDKPDLGLLCLLSCEERTSKGTETKHGQSSVPFLIFKRFLERVSTQDFSI